MTLAQQIAALQSGYTDANRSLTSGNRDDSGNLLSYPTGVSKNETSGQLIGTVDGWNLDATGRPDLRQAALDQGLAYIPIDTAYRKMLKQNFGDSEKAFLDLRFEKDAYEKTIINDPSDPTGVNKVMVVKPNNPATLQPGYLQSRGLDGYGSPFNVATPAKGEFWNDTALNTPAGMVALGAAGAFGAGLIGGAGEAAGVAGDAGLVGSVEGTLGTDLLGEYGLGTVAGGADAAAAAGTAGTTAATGAAAGTAGVGLDTVGAAANADFVPGTFDGANADGSSGAIAGDTSAAGTAGTISTGGSTVGSTAGLTAQEIQQGYRMVNGVRTLVNAATGGSNVSTDNNSIINAILGGAGALITAAGAPDTTAALNAATNATNLSTAINANQWDYYVNNYRPAETLRINRAVAAGSPEEQARARGAANADVTGAFNTAEKDTARRMQSFGINPGSPAYQASMASGDLMKGATTAGALTSADRSTQARADALLADVTNTGRNIPSNAAAGLNSSATANLNNARVSSGVNAANQAATGYGLNSVRPLVNAAADWFGTSGSNAGTSGVDVFGNNTDRYVSSALGSGTPFDADIGFAEGGTVTVKQIAGRSAGTVSVTEGADRVAAAPAEAQTSLTKAERDARTAKTNQGPTDPAMRRQMGLPPLKFADGGAVIDAERTGPMSYDATSVKSVLQSRGLNDVVAHTQAHGAAARHRSRAITPHMRRFAEGGGVGRQGMPDDSDMGQDVSAQNAEIQGPGGPTDDAIPAEIDGQQPAALSSGEFVVNADAVELTGEEILAAINEAGLRKRQQHGLDSQQGQQMPQGFADGGNVESRVKKMNRFDVPFGQPSSSKAAGKEATEPTDTSEEALRKTAFKYARGGRVNLADYGLGR